MIKSEDLSQILQEIEENLVQRQSCVNKSFECIFELLKNLTAKAESCIDETNSKIYNEVEMLVKDIRALQEKKRNMDSSLKIIKDNITELFKPKMLE